MATAQQGVPPAAAPRPANGPLPAAAPAATASGTNIAVLDIAYIFKNHVRFNAQMNDMKRDIEAFDAYVREEQRKMQTKAEALRQFNPASAEYKKAEEELAHMQSDLQIKAGVKKKEFLEQEAKVYYNVYREVEQSVAVFAQRNRIGMVLRFTGDEMKPDDRASVLQGVNRPVVFQQNLDITEYILGDLNKGAVMAAAPPAAGGAAPAAPAGQVPPGTPARPVVPQRPATIQR
jgi:Skp family chaperone for outer membrane proteins